MLVPSANTVFIVRHGERLDHVQELWQPDPAHGIWDPPLSPHGHEQARRTGRHLIDMMHERGLDPDDATIVIYTSPFQRCIDTSIGLVHGMEAAKPPILRLDLGLGEWMCERFFDQVCPAQQLLARQQQELARQQALTYAAAANPNMYISQSLLPSMHIDYGFTATVTDFEYPEYYTDMLQRFNRARLACLGNVAKGLPKSHSHDPSKTVIIMVTHAVGVNALLDSFRNRVTRPVETSYCSVSCIEWHNPMHCLDGSSSDQSDDNMMDDDDEENLYAELAPASNNFQHKSRWKITLSASGTHLQPTT
ncbi:histidine phosphatase superfamily [Radiomyces spectabilis]|uniref:histidine phosphatase superfamily n=1 Tax=Radiomyces spectabilis TaxID=64574 RepID=UPI00221E4715|nr:histidine phosphatase superfamily [Radiomyces spectabilis]KAI8388552.1 histidine phosphatase superfamily [Radiomyces spectabilis]